MSPLPEPLPDRAVILGLLATLMLCFALVFWFVRMNPSPSQQPLQWREAPPAAPRAAAVI